MEKKMLLIEDSITTQKAVMTAFEGEDIEIITANDAMAGLHELRTLIPDIILADASMPDIDGFQLCQRIRTTESVRHVPVLLLTSTFASYDKAKGDRAGVTAHVSKPFEPHTLRNLVQQLVTDSPWGTDALDAVAIPSAEASVWSPEALDTISLPPSAASDNAMPDSLMHQALGRSLVHAIRDAVHTHLGLLLENMAPQILETIQHEVNARMPELLEALLQREIDKLKQAVASDEPHGDQ